MLIKLFTYFQRSITYNRHVERDIIEKNVLEQARNYQEQDFQNNLTVMMNIKDM